MSGDVAAPPVAISAVNVSKRYQIYGQPADRLKEFLWPRRRWGTEFWALRDVTIDVPRGQVLGLVGANGSGKSTLLQLIAGVLQPTTGAVAANGRVTALLELGAGFNPEFTGRENVLLNAVLLGLSETEARTHLPAIIDFAEIGDFIDRPVKTYSSGMYVRLAFATAVNVDPDILIVDEALAVGDVYFQQRCMRRMHQFRAEGKTIIFVSHDTAAVKALCDRAILLDHGAVIDDGPADHVVAHYLALTAEQGTWRVDSSPTAPTSSPESLANGSTEQETHTIEWELPNCDVRHGSGAATIIGLGCYSADGMRTDNLQVGEPLTVQISVRFNREIARPNIGFVVRDRLGADLAGTNSTLEGFHLPAAPADAIYTMRFRMMLPALHPGAYSISPTIADGDLADYVMCDWIENARIVQIGGVYRTGCIMHPLVDVELLGVTMSEGSTEQAASHD